MCLSYNIMEERLGSDKLFQNFYLLFYSQILTPSPYYSTEGTYYSQRLNDNFSGVCYTVTLLKFLCSHLVHVSVVL